MRRRRETPTRGSAANRQVTLFSPRLLSTPRHPTKPGIRLTTPSQVRASCRRRVLAAREPTNLRTREPANPRHAIPIPDGHRDGLAPCFSLGRPRKNRACRPWIDPWSMGRKPDGSANGRGRGKCLAPSFRLGRPRKNRGCRPWIDPWSMGRAGVARRPDATGMGLSDGRGPCGFGSGERVAPRVRPSTRVETRACTPCFGPLAPS